MIKIVVYTTDKTIGDGYVNFEGEDLEWDVEDDKLLILHWNTADKQGNAVFAKGAWQYMCMTLERKLLP